MGARGTFARISIKIAKENNCFCIQSRKLRECFQKTSQGQSVFKYIKWLRRTGDNPFSFTPTFPVTFMDSLEFSKSFYIEYSNTRFCT